MTEAPACRLAERGGQRWSGSRGGRVGRRMFPWVVNATLALALLVGGSLPALESAEQGQEGSGKSQLVGKKGEKRGAAASA